jgi:hypothetical protein
VARAGRGDAPDGPDRGIVRRIPGRRLRGLHRRYRRPDVGADAYAEAGVEHFVLNTELFEDLDMLELLAAEVLPKVAV